MAEWADGYVTDRDYVAEHHAEHAPAHLDFALLQRGIAPPEPEGGAFRYLDIGCGLGFGALLIAAANPAAEIHGIDFMPGHVAWARRLARAAGIANARFHEMSFAEAAAADLPGFDYAVAHGVYAWVSAENRAAVVRLLARHLAPGGVACIGYNAVPGWAQVAALRHLLSDCAKIVPGPSAERARSAIAFAGEVQALGAAAFEANPRMAAKLAELPSKPEGYVAHEYLNESWRPLAVTEVMAEMAAAKLDFAAEAKALKNAPRVLFSEEARGFLSELPTEGLRELVGDYLLDTAFRDDLYVKGARRLDARAQLAALSRLRMALRLPPGAVRTEGPVEGRPVAFPGPATDAVLARLAEGPQEIGDLLAAAGDPAAGFAAVEGLAITGQGVVLPAGESDPAPARRLNAELCRRAVAETPLPALASPLGVGLDIGRRDQLWLGHLAESPDAMAEALMHALIAAGRAPEIDGGAAPGEAARARLAEEAARFRAERLPVFARLGLAPA